MKNIIKVFILLGIFSSLQSYSQIPEWMNIGYPMDDTSFHSDAPLTSEKLFSKFLPQRTDGLIGTKIEFRISESSFILFVDFNDNAKKYIEEEYYKSESLKLEMNQAKQEYSGRPDILDYSIGYTEGLDYKEIPLSYTFNWKQQGIDKSTVLTIRVLHYYSDPFFYPEIEIKSKSGTPLKEGLVEFVRLGPGDREEDMEQGEIENGQLKNNIQLSAGHYQLELLEPENCESVLEKNLVILPTQEDEKFKYTKSCDQTYDIKIMYHAYEFVHVELVWEKVMIKFLEEGEEPQVFDIMSYREKFEDAQEYEEEEPYPTDIYGEPLRIPYSMMIPGIGKQTTYGWPENESAIPKVKLVEHLGGYEVFEEFRVVLEEDALNSCNISQIGDRPIYLELNFDLEGRYPNSGVWQQVDVGTREKLVQQITGGRSENNYPVDFNRHIFTEDQLYDLKDFEEFSFEISNGAANIFIEFNLSEEEEETPNEENEDD